MGVFLLFFQSAESSQLSSNRFRLPFFFFSWHWLLLANQCKPEDNHKMIIAVLVYSMLVLAIHMLIISVEICEPLVLPMLNGVVL